MRQPARNRQILRKCLIPVYIFLHHFKHFLLFLLITLSLSTSLSQDIKTHPFFALLFCCAQVLPGDILHETSGCLRWSDRDRDRDRVVGGHIFF